MTEAQLFVDSSLSDEPPSPTTPKLRMTSRPQSYGAVQQRSTATDQAEPRRTGSQWASGLRFMPHPALLPRLPRSRVESRSAHNGM